MGFAIPGDVVHSVADALIKSGRVIRPWLGIGVVGPSTASRLGIPLPDGLLVEEVYPGGPGATGGLQPGDVIMKVGGQAVHRLTDLYKIMAREKIGTLMTVVVRRGRGVFPLRIKLTDMPRSVQEGRPDDRVHQGGATPSATITTRPAF